MGTEPFDVTAAVAARDEAAPEAKRFVLRGEDFTLPARLPFFATRDAFAQEDSTTAFMRLVLGEQWEAFLALEPDTAEMEVLSKWVVEAYGFGSPGESAASPDSSSNGGRRSRRTSPATTAST